MVPKKKIGRPKLNINEEQVGRLASIDCSYDEMALILGCSESTLHKSFSSVIEKGRADGKSSLKRTQFKIAMGSPAVYDSEGNKLQAETLPNPTMLIWLGKIRLGQREVQHVRLGQPDGKPLPTQIVNIYIPSNNRDELPRVIQERLAGKASDNGAGD